MGKEVADALTQCMEDPNVVPSVYMYAMLSKNTKSLNIAVKSLNLLGESVTVDGCGSYTREKTQNQTTEKGMISLKAKFNIHNLSSSNSNDSSPCSVSNVELFISEAKTTYSYEGGITPSPGTTSSGASPPKITNPLGGMGNICFSVTKISGTIQRRKYGRSDRDHSAHLIGTITVGTEGTPHSAEIIIEGGKPKVVAFNFPKFNLVTVFKEILGMDRMDDYEEFDLSEGHIYYAKENITIDNVEHKQGWNASGKVQIWGHTFTGRAGLTRAKSGGTNSSFEFDGTVDNIITGIFMKISSATVSIKTNPKEVAIRAKATFFGVKGFEGELAYKFKTGASAHAEYRGSIKNEKLNLPGVSLIYRDECFGVSDWKMEDMDGHDHARLDDAIVEASKTPGKDPSNKNNLCQDLIGLLFSKTIKTTFHFRLKEPTTGKLVEGGRLRGTLHWSYDIELVEHRVAGLEMSELQVYIEGPFTMDKARVWLIEQIKNNVVDIGTAILSKPLDLAEIIAVAGVDAPKQSVIEALLCRGINDKNDTIGKRGVELYENDKKGGDDNDGKYDRFFKRIGDTLKKIGMALGGILAIALGAAVVAGALTLVEMVGESAFLALGWRELAKRGISMGNILEEVLKSGKMPVKLLGAGLFGVGASGPAAETDLVEYWETFKQKSLEKETMAKERLNILRETIERRHSRRA